MGMLNYLLLVSRQGKVRLTKWYETYKQKEKTRIMRELSTIVLRRPSRLCNFLEWGGQKVIYRRYASLYFVAGIDPDANELLALEAIHHFVEVLDRYFGNVCELDIIFNFHKAYYLLDEVFIGGDLQEVNKREILRICTEQDALYTAAREGLDETGGAGSKS